jgi:hypothetical protein
MSFNTHDLGDKVRVSGAFTLVSSGAAVDPDTVSLIVTDPDGLETTYVYLTDAEVVKDSTGNYHADISASAPGTWYYRWLSTGNGQAGEAKHFHVRNKRGAKVS